MVDWDFEELRLLYNFNFEEANVPVRSRDQQQSNLSVSSYLGVFSLYFFGLSISDGLLIFDYCCILDRNYRCAHNNEICQFTESDILFSKLRLLKCLLQITENSTVDLRGRPLAILGGGGTGGF